MEADKLKVLIVASEVNPFAKSGGLGDVIGSLPKELVKLGIDARVVMPKYRSIKQELIKDLKFVNSTFVKQGWRQDTVSVYQLDEEVTTYFIENDYYFGRDGLYGYGDDFERFSFFSEAVLNLFNIIDFKPDIIHLNDWQTGLVSLYLRDNYKRFTFYKDMKTLITIHNLQYQGVFGREVLYNIGLNDGYFSQDKIEFYGNINYMKAGLLYSDKISTVSETYANEVQTPSFGYGMDGILRQRSADFSGIVNGIDSDANDPETDKRIFANFSKNDFSNKLENKRKLQERLGFDQTDAPVISLITRLVDQKGLDLLSVCMDELMDKDIQLVVLGTGDGRYENLFKHYAYRFPKKLSANIFFDADLAQKIYAASDFFLMPSLFEPCGLGQLFAMRYGAIPIARKTGGLSDTIKEYNFETKQGTGFLFEDYIASGMIWAINQALRAYYEGEHMQSLVKNAMNQDFSWQTSAKKYIELYKSMI